VAVLFEPSRNVSSPQGVSVPLALMKDPGTPPPEKQSRLHAVFTHPAQLGPHHNLLAMLASASPSPQRSWPVSRLVVVPAGHGEHAVDALVAAGLDRKVLTGQALQSEEPPEP
jgi:hypothetical protein